MIVPITKIQVYEPLGLSQYISDNSTGVDFPITDSCERNSKLMGEDYVRLVFKHPYRVVFDAFSFIDYNGQLFFLREQYIPTPDGTYEDAGGTVTSTSYSYDVKFVSVGNMLDKFICYRHVKVDSYEWDEPEININGNLETLYVIIMGAIRSAADRLIAQYGNIKFAQELQQLVTNGLTIANGVEIPNTSNVKLTANTNLLTYNFSGENIANVCTTVANNNTEDKKDTEWYIQSGVLHFSKCLDESYGVQYISDYAKDNIGADKDFHPFVTGGLKKVEYAQSWSGIANVIVPYGSDRNMSYRSVKGIDEITQMQSTFGKRLRLEPSTSYSVLDKDGATVVLNTDANGAIRNEYVNTGIEEVKFFDDIYPQGHFRVTKVEVRNKRRDDQIVPEYTIEAEPIGVSDKQVLTDNGFYPIQIEEGTTLSVRFESGLLNGREFEIANKVSKDSGATTYSMKFTIVADGSVEDGTLIPSGNFIPREKSATYTGDEFALFNMKMPDVYIIAAQQELAQRAYNELVEIQESRPEVKCTTDPVNWNKEIDMGYQFNVSSELFNSSSPYVSRVISYSYKLSKPNDLQFSLASAIMRGTLTQMNDLIADVTSQAGGLEQRTVNLSRRGWRDASEMAEMLNSLAADMMLVGNEKNQFAFTAGISIENDSTNTNAIVISEGTMEHTQEPYTSYTDKGWWAHGASRIEDGYVAGALTKLVSAVDTPFYLYAVVGQTSNDIVFELHDTEQTGEPYLLLGILSSAFDDNGTAYRVFNRTNGFTQIAGGTITTEQIQDAGRNLIIDFGSNPPRIIARGKAKITGNIEFNLTEEQAESIANKIELEEIGVIGGENLCPTPAIQYDYKYTFQIGFTKLINLEAGEKYIATYVKFEDNCGTADEWAKGVCLVVSTSPYAENIEAVYNFGDIIEVNGNGRGLYVAWGIYDYIDYIKGTTPSEEIRQTAFTQYLDGVMVQKGERATSYQEYVQHITNALQGTTEVSGGLVMTNVLMLKDEEQNVNAGMSGLKENVLMWGGGEYQDALFASEDEDFHKKDGTPITTLLKKDGTGKMGVFKISDTQAVVDVPNIGKVVIDADATKGGIRILNSKGIVNAALLPTSISAYKPLSDTEVEGEEKYVDFSSLNHMMSSTSQTFTFTRTGSFIPSTTTEEELEEYTKTTIVFSKTTRVSVGDVVLSGSINMESAGAIIGITCDLLYDGYLIKSITRHVEKESGLSYISLADETFQFGNIDVNVEASDGKSLQLRVNIAIANGDAGASINSVSVNTYIDNSVRVLYKETTTTLYNYPSQTIIGSDGIISMVGNSKYFMVENSGSEQKIYAKGLQATKPTITDNGELYISNTSNEGLLKTLKDAFAKISAVLSIAKYEGIDAVVQKEATDAIASVIEELDNTSIVANS